MSAPLAAASSPASHQAFQRLPIVNIAALGGDDPAAEAAAVAELGQAARDCGFFYLTGHGVAADLRARLLAQAERFFALSLTDKMAHYIGHSPNHRGYVPEGEEVFAGASKDRKEGFDLSLDLPADDPLVLAGTPMTGPNVWPDLDGFRADVGAYYQAVMALGRRLCAGFALALGLPRETFLRHVTKPVSQLRLLHYPFDPATPPDVAGIGAHTDYEIFTILLPTAPGLEVMNGAGQWIDAPPVADTFVVNIGDMLESWTNGTLIATSHRVRRVAEERYSFPLFFACDYHTKVEPLAPFVSPDRPPAYPPLLAGDHLYAQTIQCFTYLRHRLAAGTVALPQGALAMSSFGQEARYRQG